MEIKFDIGDHVARRSHVDDEGIVLAVEENDYYFVIFADLRNYVVKPILELVHADNIHLLNKQIHIKNPLSKFKK